MTQQGIDVDKLEKELVSALEADRKYSRENDAKFRAVHQKVGTYEEFREIVKASHLTPLDHDDITGRKGRKQPWNPIATTTGPNVGCVVTDKSISTPSKLPSDTQTFVREWRKMRPSLQDRYQFVMQFECDQLREIFKVEVSMGLLGEILEALNASFLVEDANKIMDFLEILSKSSRFNLSLSFLSTAEKAAVRQLFVKIRDVLEDEKMVANKTCRKTSFVDLCKIYEVTL